MTESIVVVRKPWLDRVAAFVPARRHVHTLVGLIGGLYAVPHVPQLPHGINRQLELRQ